MARLLFLSLVVLLVFAPLGMSYGAGIYWDRSAAVSEGITDKDFDMNFEIEKRPKTLEQRGVYDDRQPPSAEIEPAAPTVPQLRARTTPATRRSIETPRRLPKPRSVGSTPQVTEAAPGTSKRTSTEKQTTRGPTAPPEKKKLPAWGKVDTKPGESKSKFKWGGR